MDLDDARRALVGTWRLLSYADRDASDEPWDLSFGRDPIGLIVYHRSGLLAAQVARRPPDQATVWTYVGYVGTFEVQDAERSGDVLSGVVLHHMEAAHPPELLEEGPARDFRIQDDELLLGDGITARRVFERI